MFTKNKAACRIPIPHTEPSPRLSQTRGENQENCTGNQKYQQPMVPMCQPTTVVAGHTRWLLFTFGNIGFIFFIQPSLIVSKIMRNFAAV